MNLEEIRSLVALGESDTLELKKSSASLRGVGKTVSAFLNTRGGTILVGVAPSGELLGQSVTDSTQKDLASMIARVEPPAAVDVAVVPLSERLAIIALSVGSSSTAGPHAYAGRVFERIGSTNSVMSQLALHQRIVERSQEVERWETRTADRYAVEDFDEEEVLRTVRGGIQQGRLILDRLKLRRDGRFLRRRANRTNPHSLVKRSRALLESNPTRDSQVDDAPQHPARAARLLGGAGFLLSSSGADASQNSGAKPRLNPRL